MSRRGGQRLRRRVRQHQLQLIRQNWATVVVCSVVGYFTIVAMGLGVPTLLWAGIGVWPPPLVGSPFGRGLIVGVVATGGLWWARELWQLFAAGAERDRKGADGEQFTDRALRPLRRQGWRVLHDIEFPGEGNVDHLLIGPGGVIALDSMYTTQRLWVTPKAIGGSHSKFISQARWSARLATRALAEAGHPEIAVETALVFWGPGAPKIDDGHMTIQNTLVLEGRAEKNWRKALSTRPCLLDPSTVKGLVVDLKQATSKRTERRKVS